MKRLLIPPVAAAALVVGLVTWRGGGFGTTQSGEASDRIAAHATATSIRALKTPPRSNPAATATESATSRSARTAPESDGTSSAPNRATVAHTRNHSTTKHHAKHSPGYLRRKAHGHLGKQRGQCAPVIIVTVGGTGDPNGDPHGLPERTAAAVRTPHKVMVHYERYPANSDWAYSEPKGEHNLRVYLTVKSAHCPRTDFAIVGYSQGAWVVANMLAAHSLPAAGRVKAIVLYGDPSFQPGRSFNRGGATPGVRGIVQRRAHIPQAYAPRIRSFCHASDTVCQRRPKPPYNGHMTYGNDRRDAARFIATRLSHG